MYLNLVYLEKEYISHLGNLTKYYIIPLKKKMTEPKPPIPQKEFLLIFSNIEEIISIHGKFQLKLEDLGKRWPFVDGSK